MRANMFRSLSDRDLSHELDVRHAHVNTATAELVVCMAEYDERRLYLGAGYSSMYAYCFEKLEMSKDVAYKRIRAARAVRRYPALFEALASGRLEVSDVVVLAPHLNPENAAGLIAEAVARPKSEIEDLIATRFPRTEAMPLVCAVTTPAPAPIMQLAPGPVLDAGTERSESRIKPESAAPLSTMKPIAAERFELRFTIGRTTREKLEHVRSLLSHCVPSGDLVEVFDRALDALAEKHEKRKFAGTSRPRGRHAALARGRAIPAEVRRAVWRRDKGRCTFVSDSGHRCDARKFVEFDHVEPVARGGGATVEGIRLRCRAHNQYEAERVYGSGFMDDKRRAARRAAAEARERAVAKEQQTDVVAGLRNLGFRAGEARRAAEFCSDHGTATLEERMIAALKYLRPKRRAHLADESTMTVGI